MSTPVAQVRKLWYSRGTQQGALSGMASGGKGSPVMPPVDCDCRHALCLPVRL